MPTGSTATARDSKPQLGFTYVGVLVVLTVMMLALGAVAQIWHTEMQRENEQELLFVGKQFRTAIGNYYAAMGRQFPASLEDLLGKDGEQTIHGRYLRRIYRDPVTGAAEWGVVRAANGGVAGVYSLSEGAPYKTTGFGDADSLFEGKQKYSEWQFVYEPLRQNASSPADLVNGFFRPAPRIR